MLNRIPSVQVTR